MKVQLRVHLENVCPWATYFATPSSKKKKTVNRISSVVCTNNYKCYLEFELIVNNIIYIL